MSEVQLRARVIEMTKNPMMIEFTGERIVERLTEKDLIRLDKIMKKNPSLNITSFLRILRKILQPTEEEDFYLTYGLFRLFQEICLACRHNEVTFNNISTMITQKMPSYSQDMRFSQKLYPLSFEIPDSIKKKIFAPEVIGKVLEERERLEEKPYLLDKFLHLNRRVGQSYYSLKNNMFITIDNPSDQIVLLDGNFDIKRTVKSELEFSKRDGIVQYIAWSEEEQKMAAILGNYSLSFWAMEDQFRFQVNIPLPLNLYLTPYTSIGYMESSKLWYALDSRPSIYILSHSNFEPEYTFKNFKMINEKNERVMTLELKYRKLLCIAFEKNVFLISLQKRQLVTQLRTFTTAITSIAFSQTYQALFVSNFQNKFYSFELTQHLDLTQKGKFQGHKNHVSLLGVLEQRPVIYSIDEKSVCKLWDIRDFMCYQTFQVLKNVEWRQMIALPQSVCLVGSKHFCYRWQRYATFQQKETVVYINHLEKNILIVTNVEVRLYSHSNGVLLKVLKGVFGSISIVKAYLIELRKLLVMMNDQGLTKLYSTLDFSPIMTFQFPPKPHYMYYDKQTQLIAFGCMGQVKICALKELSDLPQKRRIHNRQEMIKFCEISALHDMVVIQYQFSPYVFFYSFERGKLLGFLMVEDMVAIKFMENLNVILILCEDKLLVTTYKKNISSLAFFMRGVVELWQAQSIQKHSISFYLKSYDKIVSRGLGVFENKVVVISNDASFHCHIVLNMQEIRGQQVRINKEMYNPYRIAIEDHLESFDPKRPSIVLEQKSRVVSSKQYFKKEGNRIFVMMSQINYFYCVADQLEVVFYDMNANCRGVINYRQTLPLSWDLHNYSQQEFKELEFVLNFIEQEKERVQQSFSLTNPKSSVSKGQIITMGMLKSKQLQSSGFKTNSLRQKKMVLEKERDEKQKEQNFQEVRRNDELIKLKSLNSHSNQKYISESLAFLSVNRNKMLLTKGIPEIDLPQIRALQFKLNAVVMKDEKKSIVSKYSGCQDFISPVRKVKEEMSKTIAKQSAEIKMLQQTQRRENYRDQLKRLNLSLRQSKFKRIGRNSSLPVLKPL